MSKNNQRSTPVSSLAVTPLLLLLLLQVLSLSLLAQSTAADAQHRNNNQYHYLHEQWRQRLLKEIVTPAIGRAKDVQSIAHIATVDLRLKNVLSASQRSSMCDDVLLKRWNTETGVGNTVAQWHNLVVGLLALRCNEDQWRSTGSGGGGGDDAMERVKGVLRSGDPTSAEQIYHTSRIISLLRRELKDYIKDNNKQLALLFDRANALATDTDVSSSVSDLGYAYESLLLLRPLISSTSSRDALTETYRIAADTCDRLPLERASLKDVAVYLRGVSKLTAYFDLKKIGKEQIERIMSRLLAHNGEVKSLEDVFHLVEGLGAPASAKISLPYVSSFSRSEADSIFSIVACTYLGTPLPGAKIVLNGILKNGKPIADGSIALTQQTDGVTFTWDGAAKGDRFSEAGLFQFDLELQQSGASAVPITRIYTRYSSKVTVKNFTIRVKAASSRSNEETYRVGEHPSQLKQKVLVTNAETKIIGTTFSLEGISSPHQVFLRFYNAKHGREAVFVVKQSGGNRYSLDLHIKQVAGDEFDNISGDYRIELFVGDFSMKQPIVWNIGIASLEFDNAHVIPEEKELYAPKPEIKHMFREPAKRAPATISTTFTIVVLLPLLVLIVGVLRIAPSITNFPSGLNFIFDILFQLSIFAILAVIFWFWIELSAFETIKYILGLGIIAILTGSRALRAFYTIRTAKNQ